MKLWKPTVLKIETTSLGTRLTHLAIDCEKQPIPDFNVKILLLVKKRLGSNRAFSSFVTPSSVVASPCHWRGKSGTVLCWKLRIVIAAAVEKMAEVEGID